MKHTMNQQYQQIQRITLAPVAEFPLSAGSQKFQKKNRNEFGVDEALPPAHSRTTAAHFVGKAMKYFLM
jgi:hypothetical protein